MDINKLQAQADSQVKEIQDYLANNLSRLTTGRASAAMVETVKVNVYGTLMPLNQLSNITAPEAQLIQITPFDSSNIEAISAAIRNNPNLGLNPSSDGRVIRLNVPPLTEERRREIAKQINEKLEEAIIRLRSIRHDFLKQIDASKKDKQISEDDARRFEKMIDLSINQSKSKLDDLAKAKEKEVLTI